MRDPGSRISQLDQLKTFTRVVADTGDFEAMKTHAPPGRHHQFFPHRHLFNEDGMATEKTAEGIRRFAAKYHERAFIHPIHAGSSGLARFFKCFPTG